MKEFFRSTDDVEEAHGKAQEFLRNRLQKLYPDIADEEAAEIHEHSGEIIAACEQKVLTERAAAANQVGGGETDDREGAGAEPLTDEDEDQLSEDEVAKGVILGRVAMRIGGGIKLVPYRVAGSGGKWDVGVG